jgi:hypothetical protein
VVQGVPWENCPGVQEVNDVKGVKEVKENALKFDLRRRMAGREDAAC